LAEDAIKTVQLLYYENEQNGWEPRNQWGEIERDFLGGCALSDDGIDSLFTHTDSIYQGVKMWKRLNPNLGVKAQKRLDIPVHEVLKLVRDLDTRYLWDVDANGAFIIKELPYLDHLKIATDVVQFAVRHSTLWDMPHIRAIGTFEIAHHGTTVGGPLQQPPQKQQFICVAENLLEEKEYFRYKLSENGNEFFYRTRDDYPSFHTTGFIISNVLDDPEKSDVTFIDTIGWQFELLEYYQIDELCTDRCLILNRLQNFYVEHVKKCTQKNINRVH